MSLATFVVLACVLALGNAQVLSPAAPLFSGRRAASPKALSGITDCGIGELVDVRLSGCTQAPCTLTAGQSYQLQGDFRSRDQHWILRYAMIVHQENQLTTIFPENAVPDSVVTPGQLYTFSHDFIFNPAFRGKSYIRLELHENWKQEFCLIIPVNVV
ncbi:uncharacterized protein LOC110842150 [Folsomia candida]|uniref:Epididymal secretory protein E1 n=1 Tax=Folsomia candida TaxID=158441 RepID=A0A226EWK4_FOLCA|nr:uncharacterized protein LOC110842150 [Folsomia candida]OXA61454.1 hypothetical protein Fcan01_00568 [Folsomia candida]